MTPCVASARLCPAPALMERPVAPSNIRVSADDPMLDAGDRLMLMITPLSPGLTIRTLPTAAPCHCREALSISGAMETSGAARSEEHTSELQPLMRISSTVCCWKQKNHKDKKI